MNGNSLQTSFWTIILLQSLASVDMPGHGPRKMPSPRSYLAVVTAWAVLQIIADTGRDRIASTIGWTLVLTSVVVNNAHRVMNLMNGVVNLSAPIQGTQNGS